MLGRASPQTPLEFPFNCVTFTSITFKSWSFSLILIAWLLGACQA